MIAIIGTHRDDILYFDSIISNKKTRMMFDKYEVIEGMIFNQEVLLTYGVFTSYLSSACIMHLLDTNFVNLVIVVGKCKAFSKDLKIGDILVSRETFIGDVNQIENASSLLGQIPGLGRSFPTQKDVIDYLEKAFQKRTINNYKIGTIISTNTVYQKREELVNIMDGDSIFGYSEHVGLDSISGGCAVACSVQKVPFISVKVIDKKLDDKYNVENYLKVLESFSNVGRAVVTLIGDIGRKDVMRAR